MADMMFPNDRSLAAEALTGESPASAPQGNGMLQGMMPMLVQYLSAAGQDIGAGKPIGANVNAATQKNLAAQSQAKLLQKILAGGGKISMDGQKFNITGHPDLLKEGGAMGGGSPAGTGASTAPGSSPEATTNAPQTGTSIMSQILQGNTTPNPTASPLGGINANDLVGLTPENISGALAAKFTQDKIIQEQINSQYDNRLKQAQVDNLTSGGKDTADIKNYQYAVKSGFKGTFEEWKNAAETASIKEYQFAVSQGYAKSYPEWKIEIAKAGGTHINLNDEKVELEKAKGKLAGQLYFGKGEHLKELATHKNSKEYRMKAFQFDKPEERAKFEAEDTVKFMESQITGKKGTITSVKWGDKDQKTMVWTVKWPSGDTETISHAIRN